jgi:hypothetical protein
MTTMPNFAYDRGHEADAAIELVTERILPSQFDDLRRNGNAMLPEHRLMLAVLEDAVHTHQRSSGFRDARNRRLFRETDEWFASDEATSPFSFIVICQVFGLDPDYLRAGLARWTAARATNGDPGSRTLPFRIRRVSGSRHQVTVAKRAAG